MRLKDSLIFFLPENLFKKCLLGSLLWGSQCTQPEVWPVALLMCKQLRLRSHWFPQGRLDSSSVNTDIVCSYSIEKIYLVTSFKVFWGLNVLDHIRELVKSNTGTCLTEKLTRVDSSPCLQPGNLCYLQML